MVSGEDRSRSRWLALCLVVAVFAPVSSDKAYDIGGHHYMISSILAHLSVANPLAAVGQLSNDASQKTGADPYRVLESFCVELPDLVAELDAITQRIHVLKSKKDWQWGALGRCSTTVSRHMVATQWYVHGLAGLDSQKVRGAARNIISTIQQSLAQPQDTQSRVTLMCEEGFGLHLLGDTFAHSKLDDPNKLYPTGTGHWKDMHVPDYMLSREVTKVPAGSPHWSDWIQAASSALGGEDNSTRLKTLSQPILADKKRQGGDYGEEALTSALMTDIPDSWEPYRPSLGKWRKDSLTGDISDATCTNVVNTGPNGQGIAPIDGAKLDCNAVWKAYLAVAIPAFVAANADPVHDGGYGNCDAQGDELGYGNL